MSDQEERIMTLLSADNPKSRQHREERADGWSAWRCIPVKDVVESGARDALLAAPLPEAGLREAALAVYHGRIGFENPRDPDMEGAAGAGLRPGDARRGPDARGGQPGGDRRPARSR